MAARDLIVFALFAVLVIATIRRPLWGALGWVLIGLMNPGRLAWGPAQWFPFAQYIAIATLIALPFTKDHRQLKGGLPAMLLLLLLGWAALNAWVGFNPPRSFAYMDRVLKNFLFVWILLLLLHKREHVMLLVGTICLSLGFYGVKGGLFTLRTGGDGRVLGPLGSMIGGNNELAVALLMTIPLLYFLYQQLSKPWQRQAMFVAMGLCAVSVLGSYSRGALVGIIGLSVFLWWRSRNKALLGAGVLALFLVAVPFMPDEWTARMGTIKTHQEDASASFRLIAWETAYNLANDRFPLGGGMEYETPEVSQRYSPDPTLVMVPHSIYFQVLGGTGYPGLAIWGLFWALIWRQCVWLRKHCREGPDRWAGQLGSMVQVSLVGYALGGAFLNLAFWDGAYYVATTVMLATWVVRRERQAQAAQAAPPAQAAPQAGARLPQPR